MVEKNKIEIDYILIIFVIFIIIGLILIITNFLNVKEEIKIVKCYDKFNNEILGLECKEISNEYSNWGYFGIFIFMISLFGLVLYLENKHNHLVY